MDAQVRMLVLGEGGPHELLINMLRSFQVLKLGSEPITWTRLTCLVGCRLTMASFPPLRLVMRGRSPLGLICMDVPSVSARSACLWRQNWVRACRKETLKDVSCVLAHNWRQRLNPKSPFHLFKNIDNQLLLQQKQWVPKSQHAVVNSDSCRGSSIICSEFVTSIAIITCSSSLAHYDKRF